MSEFYVGLMSGTSVDAIDAVLMDFSKSNTHIVSSHSQTIDPSLRDAINTLIRRNQIPKDTEEVDTQFALASCKAIETLLDQNSIDVNKVIAVGSHGQTVFHGPKDSPAVSIQIGNPQTIAKHCGISTIGNFRQADINAGGEGAPLACAYHAEVLQSTEEERVVLNLGGITNITKLPANTNEDIIGFDTGPANTLMDAWTQAHSNNTYDKDGNWAKQGQAHSGLLESMLEEDYFSKPPPKSTGRECFNLDWLNVFLKNLSTKLAPEDVQSTLLALTVNTVAESIRTWCPNTKRVLVCGGGSKNRYLLNQLSNNLDNISIQKTDDAGVPSQWMEAMAFAWLAKLYIENKPGNIPSVTGAREPKILGEIAKRN